MKIAFIGAGVMAQAIISGLIDKGSATADQIVASDVDSGRLKLLAERYGIETTSDNIQAVRGKDVVVLSVKPQGLSRVTAELRGELRDEQLVLSIIAGATIATIGKQLDHSSLVRVMPNTPAQIGQGMSVWAATKAVTSDQENMAHTILAALGKELYVAEEKYLDMATALSGSGPAYVFLIIEALIDAGVHIGMPRDMASELALQTLLGSTLFALSSEQHPATLRNMVTSPGGTTAAGLLELEEGGLRSVLTQAVIAAYSKAQELGKEQV